MIKLTNISKNIAVGISYLISLLLLSNIYFIKIENEYYLFTILLCIILYLIFYLLNNVIFANFHQKNLRKFLLENSLTSITNHKKYYNNPLEPSIKKLGLNSFEASLFTKTIIDKMFIFELIKFIFILVAGIINLIIINDKLAIILISIFLYVGIYNFIRFCYFKFKLKINYNSFDKIFKTKYIDEKLLNKDIIETVLDYECLKNYAKIQTSTYIFQNINNELSKKWDKKVTEILNK